jgi:hypothetical protein
MINIFLIGAEHQLFQVEYAISHFNIKKSDSFLILENIGSNSEFINKISLSKNYASILVFDSWTFKDLFFNPNKHLDFIKLCHPFENNNVRFFASHYDSDSTHLFFAIVKPIQYYLLDEGTASFSVLRKRQSFNLKIFFKNIIKSFLYLRIIKIPKEIIYFTKFDLEVSKKDRKIIYLENVIDNALSIFHDNEVAFLGTSVVEVGLMDEAHYLFFLNKIVSMDIENRLYFYYAHRKECQIKLNKIEMLGFKIVKLDEPFEIFFSNRTSFSGTICSFFTTNVIFNIASCYKKLPKLVVYKFDGNFLIKDIEIFENIFEFMKKNNLIQFRNI